MMGASLGLGIDLALRSIVMAGGGPASDPIVQSINANGWSVTTTSNPPTMDPDGAGAKFLYVSRKGFNASGAAVTFTDKLTLTKRVRQAYPNNASLTADQVSVSDYVYADDSATGITNNSTEQSPKPVANWASPDRKVVGNTLRLEVVAFHRDGIACVELSATDGVSTVTQQVSVQSVLGYAGDLYAVTGYAYNLDISTLNTGAITVSGKVYPRVGVAASVLSTADYSLAREFSPRTYYKDASLVSAPRVAYVETTGNDGTGVVSTSDATAAASPFLTVLGAINAHHTAGGLTGAIIYIGNDGGTPFVLGSTAGTRTQAAGELVITRKAGVARANARVSFGAAAWRPRFGASGGAVRFYDVGIVRTGLNTIQGEATSTLAIVLDQANFDGGSNNAAIGSTTTTLWLGGVAGTAIGTAAFNSQASATMIKGIRGCTIPTPTGIEGYLLLSSLITGATAAINHAASSQNNSICAFNRIQGFGSTNGAIALSASVAVDGAAIVQNVFEYTSATSGPAVRVSADSATASNKHVIIWHNTFAGFFNNGRANIFYDEGPTARTSRLPSCVGNIHVGLNTKGDVFVADGSRVGNWAYLYGAGCRGEFSQFIDANNGGLGTSFAQEYPGLKAKIGTSNSVRQDPLFTNYQGTTSGPTVGAGGGDYTLQSGSPCIGMNINSVLAFDLAGNARSATATAAGAYERLS